MENYNLIYYFLTNANSNQKQLKKKKINMDEIKQMKEKR